MSRRLLITLGFPPTYGGMQNYLYARCLAAAPGEITVLAPTAKGYRAFDRAQAFEVYRWPNRLNAVPGLGHMLQLGLPLLYALALHRTHRFGAIECGQALPFGMIARLFKRVYGIPYLIWTYGREILKPQRYPILHTILYAVLRDATLVVAVSESTRQVIIRMGVSPERVRVLYPGVDTTRFHPKVDGTPVIRRHGLQGKRILLTVSRLVPRKGIDTMLRAFPQVREVVPDVVYLIVGDGPDRPRLEALAQRLQVSEHVHFVGWVDDEMLPAYYAACDVFVLVSRSIPEAGEVEGFGIVYLEAGACAKPVVAGASGGAVEAVRNGVNGLVVEPTDTTMVARAVIRLLQDQTLAARLGAAGWRRARRSPTWEILRLLDETVPV